jgi:hypothetical protein
MLANYIGNWPCSADHPADLAEISEFIIFVLWNESWAISPPFNLVVKLIGNDLLTSKSSRLSTQGPARQVEDPAANRGPQNLTSTRCQECR